MGYTEWPFAFLSVSYLEVQTIIVSNIFAALLVRFAECFFQQTVLFLDKCCSYTLNIIALLYQVCNEKQYETVQ